MSRSVNQRARAELFRRRAELLNLRDDLTEAKAGIATAEIEADFTDRASRAEVESRLARLDEAEVRELSEIEAAIERLDAGAYGRCEICGGPIASGRLLALPEARICIACAQIGEDRARPLRRRP